MIISSDLYRRKISIKKINTSLDNFEKSEDENVVEFELNKITVFANIDKNDLLKNEFLRLSESTISERKIITRGNIEVKQNIPYAQRKILTVLYSGRCQITDFTFLKKNGNPYFEIHHIDPDKGHHFKNLLVVSANTHQQFTHAPLEQLFDAKGWLRQVRFNEDLYNVYQIIDYLPQFFEKEIHF